MTFSDTAQPTPIDAAEACIAAAYDPAQERLIARRLRGARWRRVGLVSVAVVVAAGMAAAFTLANREMIETEIAPLMAAPAPAPVEEAPTLASSQSRPIALPGTEADPNKVQARVIVPADPAPSPVEAAAIQPAPLQMQAPPATAPRTISLTAAPAGIAPASAGDAPLPSAALGFAPLPAPRPARAP